MNNDHESTIDWYHKRLLDEQTRRATDPEYGRKVQAEIMKFMYGDRQSGQK